MDRHAYDSKVTDILSDPSTYDPVDKDPMTALQRHMNALLLSLRRSNHISQQLYDRLRCSAGRIPLLYALHKIHKPETPLQPIVSFILSPTYQLSKHLSKVLEPLVGNTEHSVHNSADFPKFISAQTIDDNKTLVSFDVVSLFTKVPVDLAIQIASQRLQNDTSLTGRTSLTSTEIPTLLEFCLNATYFAFCNFFYR